MPDWRTVQLQEVADIRVSNVDKKAVAGELPVKLCNYMDVYGNDYIRADLPFMEATATAVEIERFGVRRGDVMITKDSETPDDIGIPAVVTDDVERLVCGYHLAQLRPREALVDPTFLAKHLALPETSSYFAQRATGSTRYGLSIRTIAQTPIRLAPLADQQRIAAILASLDTAIEATEALIEKHQQISNGLMHSLITRGLDATGHLRDGPDASPSLYRDSAFGPIPIGWTVTTLAEKVGQAGCVNGPFGSDLLSSELRKEGVPVLYVQDVKAGAFRRVSSAHVTPTKASQLAFCIVRQGDVLVAKVGAPPCDACVYPFNENAIVTQDVIRVRPTPDVSATYLSALLNSPIGRNAVRRIAIEGTRERVSLTEFKALVLPWPGREEQDAIGARLQLIQELIDSETLAVGKLRSQKQGLMQDLLTGKVSVHAS